MSVPFPRRTVKLIPIPESGFLAGLAEGRVIEQGQGYHETKRKKNIPDIDCTAIRTSPSDSNTRSERAPRARTRGSERGRSPRRGRPPHRTRARAPRATRVSPRRWRAERVDEGEGRTRTTVPLGGERPCPARASTIGRIGLLVGWRDAWRERRMREALRPSERGVRTCVWINR